MRVDGRRAYRTHSKPRSPPLRDIQPARAAPPASRSRRSPADRRRSRGGLGRTWPPGRRTARTGPRRAASATVAPSRGSPSSTAISSSSSEGGGAGRVHPEDVHEARPEGHGRHVAPALHERRNDPVGAGPAEAVVRSRVRGAGHDEQARVQRAGHERDVDVGRVRVHRADQRPGPLHSGGPEDELQRRVPDQVGDAVGHHALLEFLEGVHDHEGRARPLELAGDGAPAPSVGADDEVGAEPRRRPAVADRVRGALRARSRLPGQNTRSHPDIGVGADIAAEDRRACLDLSGVASPASRAEPNGRPGSPQPPSWESPLDSVEWPRFRGAMEPPAGPERGEQRAAEGGGGAAAEPRSGDCLLRPATDAPDEGVDERGTAGSPGPREVAAEVPGQVGEGGGVPGWDRSFVWSSRSWAQRGSAARTPGVVPAAPVAFSLGPGQGVSRCAVRGAGPHPFEDLGGPMEAAAIAGVVTIRRNHVRG